MKRIIFLLVAVVTLAGVIAFKARASRHSATQEATPILSSGFWAPDGAYSRFVSPIIGVVWVLVVSRILLTRSPTTRAAW